MCEHGEAHMEVCCVVQTRTWCSSIFQMVTLLGVWLIPVILALRLSYWRMLFVWTVFSCVTSYLLYLASRKPLAQTTPRTVYRYFDVLYKVRHVARCDFVIYVRVRVYLCVKYTRTRT